MWPSRVFDAHHLRHSSFSLRQRQELLHSPTKRLGPRCTSSCVRQWTASRSKRASLSTASASWLPWEPAASWRRSSTWHRPRMRVRPSPSSSSWIGGGGFATVVVSHAHALKRQLWITGIGHAFNIVVGITAGVFVFDYAVLHTIGTALVVYALMLVVPRCARCLARRGAGETSSGLNRSSAAANAHVHRKIVGRVVLLLLLAYLVGWCVAVPDVNTAARA